MLHKKSKEIRSNFPSTEKGGGALAISIVKDEDGNMNVITWSHSSIYDNESKAFKNYKDKANMPGDPVFLLEERAFKTEKWASWNSETGEYDLSDPYDRKVDAEAKSLEEVHKKIEVGARIREFTMIVDKNMCPSCRGVLVQFQDKHPNVKINVIMAKIKKKKEV